jgi:outer membrane protein OmpA-like peptidoglycan-associated protein
MAALILLAACSDAPPPQTGPGTTEPPVTTAPPQVEQASEVFEVLGLAAHPNGTQITVERVEVLSSSIVVSGVITNGSPYSIAIGRGATKLRAASGEEADLVSPFPVVELRPAEELEFSFGFARIEAGGSLTLLIKQGGGSSPTNPATTVPALEVGPLVLHAAATRPSLPDPIAVRRVVVDSMGSGVELRVEGVNVTEHRIGVWVRISNPGNAEARIAPSLALSLIEDNLGNRYPLVLPEDQGEISIPPASARAGTLSFAGRLHPDATSINIGLNAGTQVHQSLGRVFPEFLVRDIPLSGDVALAPLPFPISAVSTVDHPTGVSVTVSGIAFSESGAEARVTMVNDRSDAVTLASTPPALVDDMGTRYLMVPPAENPHLILEPGTTVDATLVFSGRIAGEAETVSLAFNTGRSATDPNTRQPRIDLGPFPLSRPDTPPEPIEAMVFAVPDRSRLVDDELAVSQVDRITQALSQFDASVVEGGFQLTLPDSILFDFGSAELRPDARQALSLIAEILEYFADDAVIVIGHTDSIGNPASNQTLSERRAQTVVEALARDHGIPMTRLSFEGRGASEPVAPNTTETGDDNPEGRQLNRRVELVVLTTRPLPG